MARVHRWYFLVNQAGEPIEGARIWITLAGTGGKTSGIPAWVYFDEFGSAGSRSPSGQMDTLENGYYEFWVDEDEDFDVCNTAAEDDLTATSYGFNQKFRMDWDKPGIHSGWIDYVDIFPPNRFFEPVDETETSDKSLLKNKVVSNSLAYHWEHHANLKLNALETGDVITDAHGLELVRSDYIDVVENKIITDLMGWTWDVHEQSNVHEHALSGVSYLGGNPQHNSPHDLWPVNVLDTTGQDLKWNKVVSNQLMNEIRDDIDSTKHQVFTIDASLGFDGIWNWNGDHFESLLYHGLDILYPDATCYGWVDVSLTARPDYRWMLVKEAEVEFVDSNNIRVHISSESFQMKIRVTT